MPRNSGRRSRARLCSRWDRRMASCRSRFSGRRNHSGFRGSRSPSGNGFPWGRDSRTRGRCGSRWFRCHGRSRTRPRRLDGSFLRGFLGGRCRAFGRSFSIRYFMEVFANLFCGIELNRARVSLLLGDPGLGQIVNDGLGLDLEFAGQFVDANLIGFAHSPRKLRFALGRRAGLLCFRRTGLL